MHELVGHWILERIVIRSGEAPDGEPYWDEATTVEGQKVPLSILELTEEGHFLEQDQQAIKDEALRVLDITGVLMPFGAGTGTNEAHWRTFDDDPGVAYVVMEPDAQSRHRQQDYPAITDQLILRGSSLERRVSAVTDGVYLNEHVLSYVRHDASAVEDVRGVLAWARSRGAELAAATNPEQLERLRAAHPRLGTECVNLMDAEQRADAPLLEALLELRVEIDRALFMRGHKKKADTYAWALDAAHQLDVVLQASGCVYLSPNLLKSKLEWNRAALLLAHGYCDEVAAWADAALAKKAKNTNLQAVLLRACADLLRGQHAAVVRRIAEVKKRELTGGLVWFSCVAHALDGEVSTAMVALARMQESKKSQMSVLSFEHVLGLSSELVQAVKEHAARVSNESGDPRLAPLLFLSPGSSVYSGVSVSSEGEFFIPVVEDGSGGYVPYGPGQSPTREMSPEALGIDLDSYLFERENPEAYVLYALRLQLAHHRKWRNRKAKAVLTALIAARDEGLVA